MREILFRAKCLIDGRWIEGFYVSQLKANGTYLNLIYCLEIYDFVSISINPHTVGQYTGLTDKNGKKIFEGDIIKVPDCCHRGDAVGFVYYDCDETAYCAKCWGIKYQLGADLLSDSIEIIGNIHDNSEMLKECKENG